jgi:hypothetical protein
MPKVDTVKHADGQTDFAPAGVKLARCTNDVHASGSVKSMVENVKEKLEDRNILKRDSDL